MSAGGIQYQYGFSASKDKIFEEWLFAYPKSRPQKWFERIWSDELDEYQWKFSSFLMGEKQIWLNGHGLYLHVTKSGKYWRYKYSYAKREKKLSIGVYPDVSLKMARDAHLEARALLRKGLCPCAEKAKNKRVEEQKIQHTFEYVEREWYAYKLTTWSSRNYAVRVNNLLERNVFPNIGQASITNIDN